MIRWLAWVLLVLAVLALAAVLVMRDGGCDRTPPDDDDDGMEPACMPGDKTCLGAEPEPPAPPVLAPAKPIEVTVEKAPPG